MNKSIQLIICFLSIVSTIFSIIALRNGQSFINASGGFLIATCLLVVLFIEKREEKKN